MNINIIDGLVAGFGSLGVGFLVLITIIVLGVTLRVNRDLLITVAATSILALSIMGFFPSFFIYIILIAVAILIAIGILRFLGIM